MRYLLFPLVCVLASYVAADDSPPFDELPPTKAVATEPAAFASTDKGPIEKGRWVKPAAFEEAIPANEPPAAQSAAPPVPKAVPNTEALSPAPPSFAKRIAMLDVELARRVAEQPNLWQFDDIEQNAARLLSEATSDAQRQAIRAIAARADRFAAIAQRYRSTRGGPAAIAATTPITPAPPVAAQQFVTSPPVTPLIDVPQPITPTPANVVSIGEARPATPTVYDAVGELRPVVSKRPGAPKYALVGDDGKIVTFVTPAEGLNLDPLLGKRVGARGGRGFMPEYRQRHLTAQKITPLDTLRR